MTRTMDGPPAAIRSELRQRADPVKAEGLQKLFKTGPGEYGEGDRLLGVVVPTLRKIAGRHLGLPTQAIDMLLASEYHEERLAAIFWLRFLSPWLLP